MTLCKMKKKIKDTMRRRAEVVRMDVSFSGTRSGPQPCTLARLTLLTDQ